jgi:hypothetical protein
MERGEDMEAHSRWKGRIAAIREGHRLCDRIGRRMKLLPEVISVIKTHYLLDGKIDDGKMARMVNDSVHFDGGPGRRQSFAKYGTS